MAVTLRSLVDPNQVSLTPIGTTPEQDAITADIARENELAGLTTLGRANVRGQFQTPAMLSNALGQVIEPFSQSGAQPLFDWASEQQAKAQQYSLPTDVIDHRAVNNLSDAGNYITNMVGENLAQIPLTLLSGGAAQVGLRGAAMGNFAKNFIGASAAAFPLSMGENVGELRADKVAMANTTPTERLLNTAGAAAVQAPLDAVGDALLLGRAGGVGKTVSNVFKDGIGKTAKDSLKHVAKAIPEAAITEGVPEAGQEFVKQQMLSNVNPARDTSEDTHDLANSFFAGWAAGGPMSAVGRGADVAWAQGRGANEAIRNLISDKLLPKNLRESDDQSILDWDNEDNAKRNGWAKDIADRVMNSDAADYLKTAASEFYDRASQGVGDAWTSMSSAVKDHSAYQSAADSVDRFTRSVRKANDAVFGKDNAEAPAGMDKVRAIFNEHVDPNIYNNKFKGGTKVADTLFSSITKMIENGKEGLSTAELDELEKHFRGTQGAEGVVKGMTEEMVRHGLIDHDPEWMNLFAKAHSESHTSIKAKADLVKRYSPQGGSVSDSDARQIAKHLSDGFATYDQMSKGKREAFDKAVLGVFGKNAQKTEVLEAFRPLNIEQQAKVRGEDDVADMTTGEHQSGDIVAGPERQFVGSAVDAARRNHAEGRQATVADHGGMWNLGHPEKETREAIKTNYYKKMQALRQQGATVEQLTPLEYAEKAGIDPIKIARNLNLPIGPASTDEHVLRAAAVKHLRASPARMILVEKSGQVGLSKEGDETISVDEIKTLGEKTQRGQAAYKEQFVPAEKVDAVRKAFGMNKKGQFGAKMKALREAGFPNAVGLKNTPRGLKVVNEFNHSDAGRFEVHMKNGDVHVLSAQELISYQRSKGRKDAVGGNALHPFMAAVSQIMTNPDVADVKVRDRFGKEIEGEKFGEYFRLTPDLTVGKAKKWSTATAKQLNRMTPLQQSEADVQRLEEHLDTLRNELDELTEDAERDEIEQDIDNVQEALSHAQDKLAMEQAVDDALTGEGGRHEPGQRSMPQSYTDEKGMPLDTPNEKSTDFNEDGTPKHPHGAKPRGLKQENTPLPKGTRIQRIRPGVGEENLTKGMRKTLDGIAEARGVVEGRTATLDVAEDYVYRAAAAQKDGNVKARNALLLMADHHLYSALVDESNMFLDKSGEITPEVRALNDMAAKYGQREAMFQKDKDNILKNAEGYRAFDKKAPKTKAEKEAFNADPDRYTHHAHFLAALKERSVEELAADGVARKARIDKLETVEKPTEKQKHLLNMMYEEQAMARAELRERKKSDGKLATQSGKENASGYPFTDKGADEEIQREKEEQAAKKENRLQELERQQEKEEQRQQKNAVELDKLVSELAQGSAAAQRMAKNLGDAFRTLIDAIKNGELNKPELVAALREAWKNFKEAAAHADEARKELVARGTKIVQQAIKEYQENAAKLKAQAEAGVNTTLLVEIAKTYATQAETKIKQYRDAAEAAYQKWRFSQQPRSETKATEGKEYGKRTNDDALEAAADAWFAKAGADVRYRPGSMYVQRIKEKAAQSAELLDSATEALDHSDEAIGPIDGYVTHSFFSKEHGEFFQIAVPSFVSEKANHNFTFKDAINAGVVTLAYDTADGSLTILGPMPNTSAYEALSSHLEETGAEGAPYRLKGVSKETMSELLGEFHARLQKHTGKENVPYVWERKSGASQNSGKTDVKHATYFNEETPSASETVTEADMKPVREYVTKVLGPKVKVLLENLGASKSADWRRLDGEAVIRISTHALNPLSKAHHEAMHEFFTRLLEAHPEYAATLQKAANSAPVVKQMRDFFKNEPDALKALEDPTERVAYMYQLWAAGKIKLGPNTDTVFGKVAAFFRKVFKTIHEGQHAERILGMFHDGKMSEPSAVAKVLANDPMQRQKTLNAMRPVMKRVFENTMEVVGTAQNELLDSGNKGFEAIGRLFSNETGAKDAQISYLSARVKRANAMMNRFANIIEGLDEKQLTELTTHMQNKTDATGALAEPQKRLRALLDKMHDYGNDSGLDLKKVEKYFPRAWDSLKIAEDKKGWVDKALVAAQKANEKISRAELERIADSIIKDRGAEPITEGEFRVGYTPFMSAAKQRKLDFLNDADMAEFQKSDMVNIMSTYVHQMASKAEYSSRFGKHGEKLRTMLKDSVGEAVGEKAWEKASKLAQQAFDREYSDLQKQFGKDFDAIARELAAKGYHNGEIDINHIADRLHGDAKTRFDNFDAQLRRAKRAIMAMEGTLGYDINENFRKWQSGIIVYENMRLLTMSLFSQVIDPLGVLVRGGTVNDALNTFKRQFQGVVAGWKGKPYADEMWSLARKLGIIDSTGQLNSQGQLYTGLYMGETAKKWNDRLFRWNGVEGASEGVRVGAMEAAINFIKHHADPKNKNPHSERWLAELGLTKSDVKLVDGELDFTNEKIGDAIFRWADSAMVRPNAALRPSWASDPHYALIFHMKQFTYAMHKVLLERVAHEYKNGNYDPMMTMLITFVPAMILSDIMRGFVNYGGEPPWKQKWGVADYLADGVQRAGLLGIPQMAVDVGKWGPSELGGPFFGQVGQTARTYNKAYAHDKKLDDRADKSGSTKDKLAAEQFEWFREGSKKNIRSALPAGEFVKRHVFDELTN